jgi:hypothetical protein
VKVTHRACGIGGGGQDGTAVVLENFYPVRDLGGVIFARLKRQAKVCGEESRTQSRSKVLSRTAFIAPPLAPETPIAPRSVPDPVKRLVASHGIVALGVVERLEGR